MKVRVVIDLCNHTAEDLENRGEWFPLGDTRISIDNSYLTVDPTDDSFYLFEFEGVVE